ncbi:ubiquitin carboxyl-terminal hydrolase 25 [Argentina anserina]|uniref:ubiquitin carboxyl-terminal hydrolase 25 n=1 Tax=Argentina anserina TaxID=57926 RepID=UPI0021768E8B|nr:ubiquitin carboxyl-terminal hydrolase 25 [Potentilla anserina]XP_050367502.1 ubiquitin carboxyl-terminal hydrolase 25 [Potentilla anserina]
MGVQQFQLQMSWQPSLLSQKRKTGPPLGLKNLGNSCYLNSVLQCLTYTPPLANFCLRNLHSSLCDSSDKERKRECPFCILERRIVRSLSVDLSLDAPAKIRNCLNIFAEHFCHGRQEDAHEFLRYVIDACHNTCLRLKKLRLRNVASNGHANRHGALANGNGVANGNGAGNGTAAQASTVVMEIFGGALQSQVKCLSCGTESNKVDEIMDISLDVLHSNSLKDALQRFFQSELLDGQNKYKCERCNKLVAARKQMSILQAPNVLVIQLKRFEGLLGGKIDKSISFEEFLVLSSFMCKASQDSRPEYKLCGTIVHSGFSPESGHYYAYIKDAMGRWYCCNDQFVSLSTLKEVLSEKVYILFFSRTNQRSVNTASNGVKSYGCNGLEASEKSKPALPPKGPQLKISEQSSWKDISTKSQVHKVPSGPRMKLNINGTYSAKKTSLTGNGNIACKNHSLGLNGEVKDSVLDRSEKVNLPLMNVDGLNKNITSETVEANNNQPFSSPIENVSTGFVKSEPSEGPGSVKTELPDHSEFGNNGIHGQSAILGPKRKSRGSILFEHDAQSLKKVEELKKGLKEEARSILQSSGWVDEVLRSMRSRKRLCVDQVGLTQNADEAKNLLIRDVKSAFISKIPESLKGGFIKRIKSFSEEQ